MSRVFPEEDITTSPTASSSNLNTSEGTGRFSEPDDVASADQGSSTFGYPLQRMVPVESWDISTEDLSSEYDHDAYYQTSRPQSDSSSTSTFHHVDFEAVIDEYIKQCPTEDGRDLPFVSSPINNPDHSSYSLTLRRIPTTSPEYLIVQYLTSNEIHQDPWNPAPRVLYKTERDGNHILCFERLSEYDQPPFQNIANVIDFIRQTLEGLSFLHKHKITHLGYNDPRGFMMDIGHSLPQNFDRTRFRVRYHRVDFAQAQKLNGDVSIRSGPFLEDVRECGMMFQTVLSDVPKINLKLKSLSKAMTGGEFGAEDSRKLFTALFQSVDYSMYDIPLFTPARTSS